MRKSAKSLFFLIYRIFQNVWSLPFRILIFYKLTPSPNPKACINDQQIYRTAKPPKLIRDNISFTIEVNVCIRTLICPVSDKRRDRLCKTEEPEWIRQKV